MNVGIPASARAVDAGTSASPGPAFVPTYTIPPDGFVADNVTVTMGEVLPLTRPYFYPQGAEAAFDKSAVTAQVGPPLLDGSPPMPAAGSVDYDDPSYAPVLTIPQDLEESTRRRTRSRATATP